MTSHKRNKHNDPRAVLHKKFIMFLTNVLLKKTKSKLIMVLLESAVSGHKMTHIRERLADKVELIKFDPYIRKECVYREMRKIRSLK